MATAASEITETPADKKKFRADPLALGLIVALSMSVVQRVVGLGRNVLFCRLLPDEELGQWSLVYSFLIFFAPLVILGLPGCFGRYVEHYRQRNQLGFFLRRISIVTLALSVIAMMLMLFAADYFSWAVFGNTKQSSNIVLLAIVLLVFIWHNFLTELLESLRQIRLVAVMRFISSVVFAVTSIGCILLHGPFVSSLLIGFAAGYATAMIPGIVYLLRNGTILASTNGKVEMWRRILPYAGWIWLNNALVNLFILTDTYILLHFSPGNNEAAQSAVGQYHSGLFIPILLGSIASLVTGILMPYMAKAWEEGNHNESGRFLKATLKLIGIGFSCGGVVTLLLAPILFNVVLQGRYNDGMGVLPMAFVYYAWYSLSTISLSYLWCAEKGKMSAIAYGIGLVANVVLNLQLIPVYGLYGAVFATMIANALALVLIYYFAMQNSWKIDLGIVIVSLLPLILLLPVILAVGVLVALLALIINGNRVLDSAEKQYLKQLLPAILAKTGLTKFASK